MHWSHGWGLVAQILVLWTILSAIAVPQIGRYLRNRRAQSEFQAHLDRESTGKDFLQPHERAYVEGVIAELGVSHRDDAFMLDEPSQPRRRA